MTTQPIDLEQFEGHAPGPWRVGEQAGGRIRVFEYGTLETIAWIANWTGPTTTVANARLIAAATALLAELRERRAKDAAVRELINLCESGYLWNPDKSIRVSARQKLSALIAALTEAQGGEG